MSQVYAEIGGDYQQIGGQCPNGWIVMQNERPSGNYIAAEGGIWIETPIKVPEEISIFQAKAQLLEEGIYNQVDLAMKSSATDPKMRLAWETASVFRRDSPTVIAMSLEFNWTEEYVDELFIKAVNQTA